MTDPKLYSKIVALPEDIKSEVIDFIEFLEKKKGLSRDHDGRKFGFAKGSILIKDDFDEPLTDFEEYVK